MDQITGEWPLQTSQSCFDFLLEIWNRIKQLPIKIDIGWVEGHQKGEKDWWGQMNYLVDLQAKAFLSKCCRGRFTGRSGASRKHTSPRLFYESWAVYINQRKQSSVDRNLLYDTVYGNKAYHKTERTLQEYWHSHHDLPIANCDDVDWEVSRLATKRLSIGKQRWIVKFWSGHHGVGHMIKHCGKQESS